VSLCLLLAAFALLPACRMDMQDQPRYEAYEPGEGKFSDRGSASRRPVEGTVARGYLRLDNPYLYTGQGAGGATAGTATGGTGGAGATGGQATGGQATGMQTSGTNVQTGDVNVRGNTAGGLPGANEAAAMGGPDRFPFPVTMQVLERGRDRYEAFCAMCHGMTGAGDGMITRRGFQRPPSYHEDRLQAGTTPASHFFDVITNGWGAMPAYNYMLEPEDRWAIIAYIRALQLSRRGTLNDVPADKRAQLDQGNQIPGPRGGKTTGEMPPAGHEGTRTPGTAR
jgi:mono/diheme cytochrome c family protein